MVAPSALIARGVWTDEGVWYTSQKEHWRGWLSEYGGPGAYGRKSWKGRSAEFVYNHIGCPPMLLWLAEAAGVSKTKVLAAKRSALAARGKRATHCAKIRTAIPWPVIEEQLRQWQLSTFMPEVLHLNLHREFFAAIASKTKNIEYRKQSPYRLASGRGACCRVHASDV
jgi:hypothetical protein